MFLAGVGAWVGWLAAKRMAVALPGINHLLVPYNVRELLVPGLSELVSVLGLALTVYGMANGPFLFFATRRRRWLYAFPLGLVAQGLLAWCLLRLAVPIESLEDIVGSPVLGWPWDWEMMGRFIALNMAVMLQVVGAALCVRVIVTPERGTVRIPA